MFFEIDLTKYLPNKTRKVFSFLKILTREVAHIPGKRFMDNNMYFKAKKGIVFFASASGNC